MVFLQNIAPISVICGSKRWVETTTAICFLLAFCQNGLALQCIAINTDAGKCQEKRRKVTFQNVDLKVTGDYVQPNSLDINAALAVCWIYLCWFAEMCRKCKWPPCVADADIIFSSCGFFLLLFFLAKSQRSEIGCLPYFHTWCGLSADLECMSEMCCMRLAENTGRKNYTKNRHLRTISQLCWAMSSQLRNVSTIRKKLVKWQYLLHMSLQYGERRPTNV